MTLSRFQILQVPLSLTPLSSRVVTLLVLVASA